MHAYKEFLIIKNHGDMYVSDPENNILIPLDNATPEVREAIEVLNKKMNLGKEKNKNK